MNYRAQATAASQVLAFLLAPAAAHAIDLTGHSLELKSRYVHFDVDVDRATTTGDFRQGAVGLQLDYQSPYFMNRVGFDLSAYHVQRTSDSAVQKNEMLPYDQGSPSNTASSWSQFGQAAVKFKHEDLLEVKVGRQTHNSLLLKSTYSRAVQDSFRGYSVNLRPAAGLLVYGSVYDAWLPRNGDRFQPFRTEATTGNFGIDKVTIVGARYATGPFQVDVETLNSKDYLRKHAIVGSYLQPLAGKDTVRWSVGASTSSDAGSLFNCKAEKELDAPTPSATTGCSNRGRGVYLSSEWRTGAWQVTGAVAKFRGLWIEDNFAVSNVAPGAALVQDHGTNFFPTGATSGNDMTNDGEVARMLRLGYDWRAIVPGLRTTVGYKWGTGARNNYNASWASAKESEKELDIQYAVPAVKGMSVRYNHLRYTASVDKLVGSNTINAITNGGSKEYRRDNRIYVDYVKRFF